jgi:hypothetical protein
MKLQKDLQELLDDILAALYEEDLLIPGYRMGVTCTDTEIIAENETRQVHGCGEVLVDFIVPANTDAAWEMVAELFLWHLVGTHEWDPKI